MSGGGDIWLGLSGAQWLMLCAGLITLVLLGDSFLGHYRTGFRVRMQYSPFVVGALLLAALASTIVAPRADWTRAALRVCGALAVIWSIVGVGFHWYFGVVRKPGGVGWLLHHLMYHAPLLAPLGLAVAGGVALIADASLGSRALFGVVPPSQATLMLVTVALAGLLLQVVPLHYRGSFNNPGMYAPLIVPLFAISGALWHLMNASAASRFAYGAALWANFLLGFAGWGWHLRGLDRVMAGLRVPETALLDGPPPLAPLLFSLVSASGLVGVALL